MSTSKAAQIEALLATKKTSREIAEIVGCKTAYVRAVHNRLRNVAKYGRPTSPTESEARREFGRLYMRRRYRTDDEFREKQKARSKLANQRRRAALQAAE